MVDFGTGIWLYATALLSLLLLAVSWYRVKRMDEKALLFLGGAVFMGFVLFSLEDTGLVVLAVLEVAIVTFNGLLAGKTPRNRNIYVSLGLLYIALIHWIGFALIAQAMLIGILSGVTSIREYRNRIVNRKVEVDRDYVHIAGGIFLIWLFLFASPPVAITVLMLMILGGIFAISVAEIYSDKKKPSIFYKLERNGASLGHGALWLALGALFAVSFLNTTNTLVVFAAIFLGDPIATIVGIRVGGRRLPWNSNKSLSGSAAYFAVTAVVSYPLIGVYAIPIGLLAAFVESLKLKVDDNFTVSVVLTLLILALNA